MSIDSLVSRLKTVTDNINLLSNNLLAKKFMLSKAAALNCLMLSHDGKRRTDKKQIIKAIICSDRRKKQLSSFAELMT